MTEFIYIFKLKSIYHQSYSKGLDNLNRAYKCFKIFFSGIAGAFNKLINEIRNNFHQPLEIFQNFKKEIYNYIFKEKNNSETEALKVYLPKPRLSQTQKNINDLEQLCVVISKSIIPQINDSEDLLAKALLENVELFKEKGVIYQELKKHGELNKLYLADKGRKCFSLAEFEINGEPSSKIVYCLSGVNPRNKEGIEIKEKLNSGMEYILNQLYTSEERSKRIHYVGFKDEDLKNVVYRTMDNKEITYNQYKIAKIEGGEGMFSCCERKTFAFIEEKFGEAKSFHMYVKFVPCEYCQNISNEYIESWDGTIITGRNIIYSKRAGIYCEDEHRKFEEIAKEILMNP